MAPLIAEVQDGIGRMTLNRPEKHNALNNEMLVMMAATWKEWAARDDVRLVIVTGAGPKAFSAGGDLANAIPLLTGARLASDPWDDQILADPEISQIAMLRRFFPKPIIAAVNGFCMAGGMEFLHGTDIRIAAEHATFALPEVKIGLIPASGSIVRLPRQIPWARAMEILLTGERISADEALRYGLINYVVPADRLIAKAEEIAALIKRNGPFAVRKIKEVATRASGRSLDEAFAIEDAGFADVAVTQDAREGPLSFLEKRPANFTGR